MRKYIYKAKDYKNRKYKGTIYAKSEKDLREILNRENLYLISYKEYKTKKKVYTKISIEVLTFFCNKMSVLLKSGIELSKSLEIIHSSTTNKRLKEIVSEGINDLDEGLPFSQTLKKYKEIPEVFINLVRIGEKSGSLDVTFFELSSFYEKNKESKRKLVGVVIYPFVLLIMGISVLIFLMLKIIPIFRKIFLEFGETLPTITKIMIKISDNLKSNILIYLAIIVFIGLMLIGLFQTREGRYLLARIKLHNPLLKKIYNNLYTLSFTSGLSMLLESGSNIAVAIEIMSRAIGNKYLEIKVNKAAKEIKEGIKVKDAIKNIKYFPDEFTEMFAIGESTGKVKEILKALNLFYGSEYDYEIKKVINRVEPILIITMGALMLFIILSIFIPMFEIMNAVSRNV